VSWAEIHTILRVWHENYECYCVNEVKKYFLGSHQLPSGQALLLHYNRVFTLKILYQLGKH